MKRYLFLLLLFTPNIMIIGILADDKTPAYKRAEWGFKSYKADTNIGFYTQKYCDKIEIDHIVSLHDAHQSGGALWESKRKYQFANDKANHVPACQAINRSKGNATPAIFVQRSNDGKGRDYRISNFCNYLIRYKAVKHRYQLTFANNNSLILNPIMVDLCGERHAPS